MDKKLELTPQQIAKKYVDEIITDEYLMNIGEIRDLDAISWFDETYPNLGSLFLDPWEYIVAVKNGKYGILSGSHAEVVIPFEYDDIVHVNMKGYVCRKGSQEKIVCPNGYGNDGPNSCLEIPEIFLP